MVKNAATLRNDAGDKLQATIGWFWTAYTAAAVVGFAVTDKDYPAWAVILMAVPVLPLLVAYWLAGYVRVPIEVGFDPRAPLKIEAAFYQTVKAKKERLRLAVILSLVAGTTVALAILVAAFAADTKQEAGSFEASLSTNPRRAVVVGGTFAEGTKVVISITPKGGSATAASPYVVSHSGELHRSFAVPAAEEYAVTAIWDEEKVGTRSLTKTVKSAAAEAGAAGAGAADPLDQIRRTLERLLSQVPEG